MEDPVAPQPPQAAPKPPRRSPLRTILLIGAGVILLAFIAIQFIPVNRANPAATAIKWDSPQTEALAKRACMDCHSNETTWPVYSYVAPVSWLVYYDVVRGRSQMNFSTLASGQAQANPFNRQANSNDLAFALGQMLAGGGQGPEGPGGERGPQNGQFPNRGNGTPGQFPTRVAGQGQQPGQGQPAQGQGGFQRGFNIVNRINEVFQNNSMPPANYTLLHPGANLSAAERDALLKGLAATFATNSPSAANP